MTPIRNRQQQVPLRGMTTRKATATATARKATATQLEDGKKTAG
jgi:hypothetical protein